MTKGRKLLLEVYCFKNICGNGSINNYTQPNFIWYFKVIYPVQEPWKIKTDKS